MRALALDLGEKRVGVALSDATATLASPLQVLQRSGDRAVDHQRVLALVAENEVDVVVVGVPLSLDGSEGPAARAAIAEVAELEAVSPVPVETCDERLTTVSAERILRGNGRNARKQRGMVDKVAAAVMLQAWLDGRPRSA